MAFPGAQNHARFGFVRIREAAAEGKVVVADVCLTIKVQVEAALIAASNGVARDDGVRHHEVVIAAMQRNTS